MEVWQIWGVAGLVLLIIEMLTPTLFFINLSLAAMIVGITTFYTPLMFAHQVLIFAIASVLFLLVLRPLLQKVLKAKEQSGVEATYYGETAKVTEKITHSSGRIAVFGEAWNARTSDGSEIDKNANVKIISREGLTMIVEKI